jgi:Na+/proline symporter
MVSTEFALAATAVTVAVVALFGGVYARGRVGSVEEFVTARNATGRGVTTATLIASSMGAWILFSPAEAGAAFGGLSAIAGYAVGSAAPLLAYVVLGPRIRELIPEGHSITEYAYARYGSAMYTYVLLVSVFYMFIFLSAEMTGVAGALALVAGVPEWQTAGIVGLGVLAYTGYGGLRASIFTDAVQTVVILPLLAVGFVGAILSLGGVDTVHSQVSTANPQLLAPGFVPGLKFGAYVVVAVLGAELVNQAWWQRIYAAQDSETVERSFGIAALAVIPMILLAGFFGLAAAGLDLVVTDPTSSQYNADIAFFVLLGETFPGWVTAAVVVLAVLLVTSTADTLFNAISSVVTADLPRLLDDPDSDRLTAVARALTAVVALAATAIGAQGMSVLRLFLTADLLAAATFVPLLAGLYSERLTGRGALAASVSGLVVGVAYFPTLRGLLTTVGIGGLPAPSFFVSFLTAAGVSAGLTAVAALLSGTRYDLGRLSREVGRLDDVATDGGGRTTLEGDKTTDGGQNE